MEACIRMEACIAGKKSSLPDFASYRYPAGSFAAYVVAEGKTKTSWWTCREQFHSYADSRGVREFYYCVEPNRGTDLANFIYLAESRLGLVDKTHFQFTERSDVVWVEVSPWWLDNKMRYSFFTICLRAGLRWIRDARMDFRTCLLSQVYANQTVAAVDRFLDGHTQYTGNLTGWSHQFHRAGLSLDSILVKPKYLPSERRLAIETEAYLVWLESGRPGGKDQEIWHTAEQRLRSRGEI